MFVATAAHENIFAAIRSNTNVLVQAVAGSGKTTTLLECLRLCEGKVIFLAFNASIRDELTDRVERLGLRNVEVRTINGLGYAAYADWRGGYANAVVDDKGAKVEAAVRAVVPDSDGWLRPLVGKMVSYAKAAGLIPEGVPGTRAGLVADTEKVWADMVAHQDTEVPDSVPFVVLVEYARAALRVGLRNLSVVDFDDQIYMTSAYDCPVSGFDWVFVDETQDLNCLQQEVVARAVRGNVVAVGDVNQSIYGFRGADPEAMANMVKRFGMTEMPLHVTYRCDRAIVAAAQQWVPHLTARPEAGEGVVDLDGVSLDKAVAAMRSGDMVVSRYNASLAKAANALLRARIPCKIKGKDIGAGLMALIRKMRATTVADLVKRLSAFRASEVAKFMAADKGSMAVAVADKVDTLLVFCEGTETIAEVEAALKGMFVKKTDAKSVVTLSSIHKAKGLEADRVWALNFGAIPKFAKQDWQIQQERNLLYVAVTRARHQFVNVLVPRN